jgi:hypothetical protein
VVFRILGAVAFLTGFLYFLFNICYLRPRANEKINTTFDKTEEWRNSVTFNVRYSIL